MIKRIIIKPVFYLLAFMHLLPFSGASQNIYDTLRTVKMMALAQSEPLQLTIQWLDDPDVNTYHLYKKDVQATNWGEPLIVTGDQDTSYVDTDIEEGQLYEYRIIKETGNSLGYAYLFSGVNYTPPQEKGSVLLIIDTVAADFVEEKLTEYMAILQSEGWLPWLAIMEENAAVPTVKALILDYYANVEALSTVLLLGNIAVPHSGNVNPDAHNDHKGAWPADVYYGDMDGVWTDETVNNVSSNYPRIHNVPGDGNFDQDYIPGEMELAIGRLDFSELPVFDFNEYELLNRYLQKNIDFRTGEYRVKRQAVIKNINPWQEGLGQNGIRNFTPLVSPDSVVYVDFFDAFYDSFLWAYGGSSGSMFSSAGLGSIDTYADNNFQAVFTAYFGSYYGDYDFGNNYLRTILGSGKVLSTAWVGAPNWYFHPMGMGLDLGFCTLLTQNNTDTYYAGYFPQYVTINLLGDPTLTAFIVRPPNDLAAVQNEHHIELTWTPSLDSILGYQVYRKYTNMDYFEVVNLTPISDTNWIDSCVIGGQHVDYLVKAVKREMTASGSFINHSTGPIISIETNPDILPEANFNVSWENDILSTENLSINANQYQWILPNGVSFFEENLNIPYTATGEITINLVASNTCFSDTLQTIFEITTIKNTLAEAKIELYPNPAQGFFTIETAIAIDALHLYTVIGNEVKTVSRLAPGLHKIDIQNLAAGIYIVKIHFDFQVIPKMIMVKNRL